MEFKFGTLSIFEIGEFVSKKLMEDRVSGNAELTVNLDEKEFKLLDEDLFYRMRTDGTQEFIPSEGEIIVNFDKLRIVVKNKSMDN